MANAGCSATNVALGVPLTSDNCGLAAVTNNALASYPVGTNVVTWTATDTSGNTNGCQQRVIVLDSQAPTIAWHMTNVVVAVGTNCQALMPDITGTNYILAEDPCSSVTVTQSVATNAVLGNPAGLAVDSRGRVYVADPNHNVIRVLTPGSSTGSVQAASGFAAALNGEVRR